MGLCVSRLSNGSLPAERGKVRLWIIHRAHPGSSGFGQRFDPLLRPGGGEHGVVDDIEAQPAARSCEARYLTQQARHRCLRQIQKEPLKQPDRGRLGLETSLQECLTPGAGEIHSNGFAFAQGLSTGPCQHLLFVLQHLGLIKLEEPRVIGPGEPISPRIETCSQQHHLANRRRSYHTREEVIEEARPHDNDHAVVILGLQDETVLCMILRAM